MRHRLLALVLLAVTACERGSGDTMTGSGPVPTWVERIRSPARAGTGRPPLLVLLHGIGADEDDLFPLAAEVDDRLLVVSLRAPHGYGPGWAWFRIDFHPGGRLVPDLPQARAALVHLTRWIEAVPSRLGSDPARTFLLGFSQGAMMSLGVLGAIPERLAGVVALSGRTPEDLFEPTAGREAMARVPLLVAHGIADDVLPETEGRRLRDGFASLSRDFTYREFDVGHGITGPEVRLVAAWLAARL
jgi:phospholipase/carboxylesterase